MWRGRFRHEADFCLPPRSYDSVPCFAHDRFPRFHIPLISRVEDWRANSPILQVHCVSSPLHIERSGRISRTALPCVFHIKVYVTYHAGAAFDIGLRTR
jgi:hypothetical protein